MSCTVFYLKNEPEAGRHDPIWMRITMPVCEGAGPEKRNAPALAAFVMGKYEAVAKSTLTDLEEIWTSLQNGIRSPSWSMEPPAGIEPLGQTFTEHKGQKYGNRSSSVGDIFRNDETGEMHIVASFGFDRIFTTPQAAA